MSRAASAPGFLAAISNVRGLTPNGTYFDGCDDEPERASVRFVVVLVSEPDASAFRLIKVSAIGLTPSGSPLLSETSNLISHPQVIGGLFELPRVPAADRFDDVFEERIDLLGSAAHEAARVECPRQIDRREGRVGLETTE